MSGAGTPDDPWVLKTPPGTSSYTLHRDDGSDPPALVCTVGSTVLRYDARCIDDVHAMLAAHGEWMELGSTDENKQAKEGTVEAWGPVGGQRRRWLVRAAQGLPRPLRHVHPAAARGTRPRRTRTQPAQQPGQSPIRGTATASRHRGAFRPAEELDRSLKARGRPS